MITLTIINKDGINLTESREVENISASYVFKINEVEEILNKPMGIGEFGYYHKIFNKMFQMLINKELNHQELRQKENNLTKKGLCCNNDKLCLNFNINDNQWRNEVIRIINKIGKNEGGNSEDFKRVWDTSYRILELKCGVNLNTRLTHKKRRVLCETGSKNEMNKVTKLDCIASDNRLLAFYLEIMKEMAIKYILA